VRTHHLQLVDLDLRAGLGTVRFEAGGPLRSRYPVATLIAVKPSST